ncbi:MAG: GGDEF domain-containing protein [Clostridiales bacterium]|nr:GGDEF domain-containing protein [Clostridiales bacterium]
MKKALTYLGLCSGGRYGKDVEEQLFYYSKQTYHIIRLIICICEFVFIFMTVRRVEGHFNAETGSGYFILYMGMLAVTVLFIGLDILWELKRWKKYSLYRNLGFVYVMFTVIWTCGITLLDRLDGNGLTVYTYMLLMIATLAVLEPWQSFLTFTGAFVIFSAWLPYFPSPVGGGNIFYHRVNSFFIALISITVSIYFNWYRANNYRHQRVIDEQNKELCKANERLNKEIIVDSLTGLYNRRYLAESFHIRFRDYIDRKERKPLTCLMLDIDYFKQYNDTYGHQQGDECLVEISEIMKKSLPMETARIIRYGGEEFVIFIFNCSEEQAFVYAENLRKTVEKSHFLRRDTTQGYLTVSMGVYTEIPDSTDHSEMRGFICKADEALYEAKRAGRNCVKVYK